MLPLKSVCATSNKSIWCSQKSALQNYLNYGFTTKSICSSRSHVLIVATKVSRLLYGCPLALERDVTYCCKRFPNCSVRKWFWAGCCLVQRKGGCAPCCISNRQLPTSI